MQGAQNVRSEAYLQVRRNDEGEAQRRRWTFYEAIKFEKQHFRKEHSIWHRLNALQKASMRLIIYGFPLQGLRLSIDNSGIMSCIFCGEGLP